MSLSVYYMESQASAATQINTTTTTTTHTDARPRKSQLCAAVWGSGVYNPLLTVINMLIWGN